MNEFELQVRQSISQRVSQEGSAKCIYCNTQSFPVRMFWDSTMDCFYVRCTSCRIFYPSLPVLTMDSTP